MKLSKLSDSEKLKICKKYFYAGFAFLPFLWLVNFIWFFPHAFKRKHFAEQAEIKKCLIIGAIGFGIWMVALIVWNVVFHVYRVDWDAVGDYITFIPPRGKP